MNDDLKVHNIGHQLVRTFSSFPTVDFTQKFFQQ